MKFWIGISLIILGIYIIVRNKFLDIGYDARKDFLGEKEGREIGIVYGAGLLVVGIISLIIYIIG